ncbi:hypothetical protein CSB45_05340 [candidate division KSB3 bacterium]|uniref:Phosphagen kinase C-terminal domain-containing protein n=1 Tax=candidate division KSB3 bacterium TaxID=2044937 RepID=A0A2G6E8B3_9BACT|nr:MAG: hypothetical protein CSB45_05340 [candidate division KSB3 bacterium]PIE30472.1 MAG: hypothetical protein CSA57_04105 [candidate division KSB3 bacterium]
MSFPAYVISTRVRIARNLRQYPFPDKATGLQRQEVLERVCHALQKKSCGQESALLLLDRLNALERKILEEEQLISHLSATSVRSAAVIALKTQKLSVLVNEEDHLRIQALVPGLALRICCRAARRLERCLHGLLPFAYSEADGYLTTCPQNTGSGIRISVMMFLPGLTMLGKLIPLLKSFVQAGCSIRGAYGEGSRAEGYRVQLSMPVPYTQTLHASAERCRRYCLQLIQYERMARISLVRGPVKLFHWRVRRVRRQLCQAGSLSLANALHIIALCRLCVCIGFHPLTLRRTFFSGPVRMRHLYGFDRLSRRIQTAHIRHAQLQERHRAHSGIQVKGDDEFRARVLREGIATIMRTEIA